MSYNSASSASFTSFGALLRYLRRHARMSQRDLAIATGYHEAHISRLELNQRQVDPSSVLSLFVPALELDADDELIPRLVELASVRDAPAEAPSEPSLDNAAQPVVAIPPEAEIPAVELPIQPTAFVGRADELAQVGALLEHADCRLVTIVGPGGIGKTRIALEVAARKRGNFADGVAWVSLASVQQADLVAPAIAEALKLPVGHESDPRHQLINYLSKRELLLVVDNAEHVLSGITALVAEIAQAAPNVKLLVTSRERLQLRGEWLFELYGMHIEVESGQALMSSAVQLFVQSARRVQPNFELGPSNLADVVRVCRLVDGMPLAIELAATWVRMLNCSEMVDEITRDLDFLAADLRDLPDRHQSVRAVFKYSWQLLTPAERAVCRKLSLFRGGFDRRAALAVADATLPMLAALVNKSLLQRSAAGDDRTALRFDMHELIRQYAAEELRAVPDEYAHVQAQHCEYYTSLLQREEPRIKSAQQREAMRLVALELDNIRAAWYWGVQQRKTTELFHALRGLAFYYAYRPWFEEGRAAMQRLVDHYRATQTDPVSVEEQTLIGKALAHMGWFAFHAGALSNAHAALHESLTLVRNVPDREALAEALQFAGQVSGALGDVLESRQFLNEAILLRQALGHTHGVAFCKYYLSEVVAEQGDYVEAQRLLREGLIAIRQTGDPRGEVGMLQRLGMICGRLEQYAEAYHVLQESLRLSSAIEDQRSIGLAFGALGMVAHAEGDNEAARYFLHESLSIFDSQGDRRNMAQGLATLGHVELRLNNTAAANAAFEQALALVQGSLMPVLFELLLGRALLLAQTHQWVRAIQTLTFVINDPTSRYHTRTRAAAHLAGLAVNVAPDVAASAQARGRSMPLETVLHESGIPSLIVPPLHDNH